MKLTSYTATGTKSSKTASDAVFGAKPNMELIAQAIRVYMANRRQGTSNTKTRAQIARTKRKWYKQKGTGNARHGARSAPIFVGGGVAHGPKANQNWKLNLTARSKRQALQHALSAQAENTMIVDAIAELKGKTKDAQTLLTKIGQAETGKILVVLAEANETVLRALRNLPNILVVQARQVSALEVAMAQSIIVTTDSIKVLEERVK